jgi:hypothetical protein
VPPSSGRVLSGSDAMLCCGTIPKFRTSMLAPSLGRGLSVFDAV